jgi:hypothetical protein
MRNDSVSWHPFLYLMLQLIIGCCTVHSDNDRSGVISRRLMGALACAPALPPFVTSHRGTVPCMVGGPFDSDGWMHSPPSCDTILYSHLPSPKALPASSSQAWLKKPRPRNPRRWCNVRAGARVRLHIQLARRRRVHDRALDCGRHAQRTVRR